MELHTTTIIMDVEEIIKWKVRVTIKWEDRVSVRINLKWVSIRINTG
jgi:hypothetical protein